MFKIIVTIVGVVLGISLLVMGVSFLYEAIDPGLKIKNLLLLYLEMVML